MNINKFHFEGNSRHQTQLYVFKNLQLHRSSVILQIITSLSCSASHVTIMPAQDAFYTIPDSLISFILSKIPIKDAVKCCILSRRWRFLYTQMPELTFSPYLVLGSDCTSPDPLMSSVENIISNILLLHSGNLNAFHLHNTWIDHTQRRHFSHENVCKWVRYASWCNIQHLTLYDHNVVAAEVDGALKEIPPPALFSCSRLVTLYLGEYILTSFPINFAGFPHLITCHLRDVQLTDESLVSLISLCPLLQRLEMIGYAGLGNVVIYSSTIEHLRMGRLKTLSVTCPKLKILKGYMIEDLSVNGARFYELSYAVFHLEMHSGGTLRELNMDCSQGQENSPGVISASRFLHIMGNFQSLKILVIYIADPFEREADVDVPLLNLLHRLPNLQTLSIFGFFVQELARDPIPVCLTPPHLNLKKICVEILEFDHKEVAAISCLLQSMPSLEALEIQLPDEYDESQCLKLFKDIMYLRRASLLARIIVLDGAFQVIG